MPDTELHHQVRALTDAIRRNSPHTLAVPAADALLETLRKREVCMPAELAWLELVVIIRESANANPTTPPAPQVEGLEGF